MKILIVDDTTANLEAAKQASFQFPEHEFVFTNSANEAFQMLPEIDAVITDLFFKEQATGELALEYQSYIQQVTPEALLSYKELAEYSERMEASLEVLRTGTPIEAIKETFLDEDPKTFQEVMDKALKLPQEFPLGGTIMVSAKKQGKLLCLVSNVHRHAGYYCDSTSSSAAVVLLVPLLENILTDDQLLDDGAGSLTYIGESEIGKYDEKIEGSEWKRKGKTDPNVWTEAIHRVLAQ